MSASANSRLTKGKRALLPRPGTLGFFLLLVSLLALGAALLRKETALGLLGAVFLTVWLYCFALVWIAALFCKKKAARLSVNITKKQIRAGEEAEFFLEEENRTRPGKILPFLRLPLLVLRFRIALKTADGRRISHLFKPLPEGQHGNFPVKKRGAWENDGDSLEIFDALGFFSLSLPLTSESGERLLSSPPATEESLPSRFLSGGEDRRSEETFRKTDVFIDHRPYVPGDDPRRINWKLFGHGPQGELFVREGENERPPHSKLFLLLDTEADGSLFPGEKAAGAVDLLCENGLAAASELQNEGLEVYVSHTGGEARPSGDGFSREGLEAAFARPFALPLGSGKILSPVQGFPEEGGQRSRSTLLLALPRTSSGNYALEAFLGRRPPAEETEILFLYDEEDGPSSAAAADCARIFGARRLVRARACGVRANTGGRRV